MNPVNPVNPLVVGYPRTGFTLLISVIAEISNYVNSLNRSHETMKIFCDTAGIQIAEQINLVFQRRGISSDLLYNYNFKQMVGGPKWLMEGKEDTACFLSLIHI